MSFATEKQNVLSKQDKSSKGCIDDHIKFLCERINNKDDFYTTSSCSGRIVLIKLTESGRKNESEWLFTSHGITDPEELKEKLEVIPEDEVWFRYEPFILHVACKTEEDARSLLGIVRRLGIKRSGIISMNSRIVLEIIGTEHIEALVSKQGKLLVSGDYISTLVGIANKKLERNWKQIKRITERLKKI